MFHEVPPGHAAWNHHIGSLHFGFLAGNQWFRMNWLLLSNAHQISSNALFSSPE